MRPFEFFLILVTGLVLLSIISNKRKLNTIAIAIVLAITFGFHYFLEGMRWQMYLVYIISPLIPVFNIYHKATRLKWLRKSIILLFVLLIVVSGIVSTLIPVFRLPELSTRYSVGTHQLLLNDSERENRPIEIKFWFPTSKKSNADGIYSENPVQSLDGLMSMPGFIFGHLKLVKTGTFKEAKALQTPNGLPLVIYSHGAASTNLDNTALLQEIAGNGYIVMAIDYNFSFEAYGIKKSGATTLTFESQRKFIQDLVEKVVPNQTKDIFFSLQKIQDKDFFLVNHIDFSKIVLIGHSLGGTTAVDASLKCKGVLSIINMDGPINPKSVQKINHPILYLSSFSPDLPRNLLEKKGLPDIELYQKIKKSELENVSQLSDKNRLGFHWVRFKNAGHLDFTDVPFILPIMTTDGYDSHKGHLLRTSIVMDFLDFCLKMESHFKKRKDCSIEWIK
jgi:dienelactone hydrolase